MRVRLRRHVFVCTQLRDGGGKPACGARGGTDIVAAVERELARRGRSEPIGVTSCGCLGPCFDGPNAVVYPDGVWYSGLGADDAPALVDYLLGGPELADRRHEWSDE
jgi:(2Fe-2S) ferredoxin